MHASLMALFFVGLFIMVVGFVTVAAGADQRHWGAPAVLIGCMLTLSASILMDGFA